ncbi:hypothetical protein [Bradyrhizobium zhanjiangense]|uniref:hypothetical protein n=1 Tax=Bradyrhizobium zhanjiangense TaxID=1325107 RepID=UPI0010090B12|nr:hypothetical protein [Bradyrhizobium zhanjiangense]
MTAEVCLMNRLAIVLAADSATTVTHWAERGSEQRYFKGANKIFQLSDHHPVGLMIFDSADILRVPWEIVVKTFRQELEKKSFNSLADYAAEFFSFLEKSPRLFPIEVQKLVFLDAARSAALRLVTRADTPGQSPADRLAETDAMISARLVELSAKSLPANIPQEHVDQTIALWRDDLIKLFDEWKDAFASSFPSDLAAFAELGILEVFKNPEQQMGATGLVFAGFGDHDIFPGFAEYRSSGILAGKHVATETKRVSITHDTPAWLDSFAQTDMSDTFSLGISRDVYISVMNTVNSGLREFANDVFNAAGGNGPIPNLQNHVSKALDAMGDSIMANARREHAIPLRRVLGVLPVDEMAELAETLINLQSLKEKVTRNSETVGGPVDVAIITKNEGLLWAKRKHFFDINLNSRFALRQQARLV